MNLEQLEKLKGMNNSHEVLRYLIDKNDIIINEILSLDASLDKEDSILNNISYLVTYYEDIINVKKDIQKRNIIFNDVKTIINNSLSLGDLHRLKLLDLFRDSNYSYTYYRVLSDSKLNWNNIDELKIFIKNVKQRKAVDFIMALTKYRNLEELTDILNNYNINKNCYNSKIAKYRSHEEANSLIDLYNKSAILFNTFENEKKEFNKRDYLYKILINDKILFRRDGTEHINLMKYYIKNPNEKMYNMIINNNILLNRTYGEQEVLINELMNSKYDQRVFEIALRRDFNKYNIKELSKLINLCMNNNELPIYEYINKNTNMSFDNLYNSILSSFNIPVEISSIIDDYSIKKLEELLRGNNIHSFNSKTKVYKFKKEDGK